ncbi:MAG TPA: MATE family efflux transporter [Anaerolineae bacterium]|nr:MATE family efflux transporter [Anaerolineae bacterium]
MSQSSSPHQSAPLAQPGADQAAIRRDVLRLALPAMGEQLLSMMVGIVDTFLVGHLGAASLAAVGLANQWVFMAMTLFGAIATGATALIARFIGARDPEQADEVLRQAMLLGVLVGIAATVLGLTLTEPAIRLLGAQGEVIALGTAYLRIVAGIFFFSTLMFIGNASLRGAGDTRTPLLVMLVVNTCNVAVAWTLVNGAFGAPRLGVVGSALGAATGRLVGGVLVVAILLRGRSGVRLRLSGLRFDGGLIRRILHVGLPTGLEQLLFRTGHMVFARILAEMGTVVYAANQVAINAWSLSFMPGFGFALAATTLVGQSLGAEDPEGAQRRGYTAYRLGAALMGAVGLTFLLFPAQIMGFFTDEADIIAVGTLPLQMVGVIQPILAATMIFAGALRGAGDTRWPMAMTGISIWLIRLPLAYLFGLVLGWGLPGAWGAFALDLSLRGMLNFLRFRSGRWKLVKV